MAASNGGGYHTGNVCKCSRDPGCLRDDGDATTDDRGADIGPLHAAGVPCCGLVVASQRYLNFHHTAVDDLAAVDQRELALVAAVVAFALSEIADA